jgi:cysteine desulfurase
MSPIYLDHNATTPVATEVLEVMLPYFTQHFGNASSKLHAYGWVAEQAIETATLQIATLINAQKNELIFTSGATESINLALKGATNFCGKAKNHIVTCVTEHKAILETLETISKKGFEVTLLSVDRSGRIDLDQLNEVCHDKTLMVCMMHANNETGTIHPIKQIGEIAHQHEALFFCDATQSAGKMQIDVLDEGIDLCCFSAHKLNGPKGVGILYVKDDARKISLTPMIDGGGQQRGLRGGTLNVPGIVGFGKACELAEKNRWENGVQISRMRTILEQQATLFPDVFINGDIRNRLFNTTNICFKNKQAAAIFKTLKQVAVANGSACASANSGVSHVLLAMGLTEQEAGSSVRFSFGSGNTLEEVHVVIDLLAKLYE